MSEETPTHDPVALAILALLVDEREANATRRPDALKTELLLAACGLDNATIGRLMGKSSEAIRVSISRARSASKSNKKDKSDG